MPLQPVLKITFICPIPSPNDLNKEKNVWHCSLILLYISVSIEYQNLDTTVTVLVHKYRNGDFFDFNHYRIIRSNANRDKLMFITFVNFWLLKNIFGLLLLWKKKAIWKRYRCGKYREYDKKDVVYPQKRANILKSCARLGYIAEKYVGRNKVMKQNDYYYFFFDVKPRAMSQDRRMSSAHACDSPQMMVCIADNDVIRNCCCL